MDARRTITPPRFAEAILRRCLPQGARGLTIMGDLREEYYARAGARLQRAWFWREALRLSARYLVFKDPSAARRRRGAWNVSNDVRVAMRAIARGPVTALLIVVILGTATAASTIGFTFADLAILRGLPISDPSRVVAVYGIDRRQSDGRARLSLANFRDLASRVTTIEHFTAFQDGRATLVDNGLPTSLEVTRVTPEFFAAMGIGPAVGRVFQAGDDQPGRLAVVLAHHYWSRVHGAHPGVLGRSLIIDGRGHVIVGVASPEIEFGNLALTNLWLPLDIPQSASRSERVATTMGRLPSGVSLEQARAEVTSISKGLAIEYPEQNRDWEAVVLPITDVAYGRGFWVVIALFIAAVTLVMVIACANAASLVLTKVLARRREIAIRAALGAGRLRLLRQALIEGAVLSLLSVAVAVPAAEAGLRLIRSFDSEPAIQQLRLDTHELGFVGIIALITPVLFSLLPTLATIRLDLRTALHSGGMRAGALMGRGRTVLVTVQIALAVALMTAAGLAVRTGINLTRIDYGIRTTDALIFGVDLGNEQIPGTTVRGFVDEARRRLMRLPAVESVHTFESLPVLSGERLLSLQIPGQVPPPGETGPFALVNAADAGALEAIGVRLVAGRWISELDQDRGDAVALIGETTALMYFGSAHAALEEQVGVPDGSQQRLVSIAGVVTDVLSNDVERGKVPRVWTLPGANVRRLNFIVSTRGATADLPIALRREMAALAPAIPLESLETIDAAFRRFTASNQVVIGIFAGFAVLALVLAATGLYGLITYTVSQRVPEFGTRFALGARPLDVLQLVVRQVARLIAIGLAAGLAGGLAIGQGMRSVLYGVSPTDTATVLGVIGLIATVAILASVRPAIRASRLNLVEALRTE